MSDNIGDLIERVKAAKGSDRDLDVDIAWAIEPSRYAAAYWNGRVGRPGTTLPKKIDGLGRLSVRGNCPAFSGSIDAALALVDRLLPGWGKRFVMPSGDDYASCEMWLPPPDEKTPWRRSYAPHETLPLAILLALLTAICDLAALEENGK